MIDFTKYNLDEDDIFIIETIYDSCASVTNLTLCYKNQLLFDLDSPDCHKITAYFSDDNFEEFESVDELLLNFKIDGKPLIEVVKDLDIVEG